ncbi:HAD family hydrolase [Actinophytocola sp.]|uniref:HAD family hydrolase n=1 Tax=Actinophytocola sp. TaxID=1872138 RepID=UPI002D7F74CC|nr:HAD family hydrolase [Actinophytocola sp.]HET9138841.1 HAD family hydrolase [Actinophytocola sp.]
MIVDRSCSVLSLDIFDTVLWRRVPRPTDVFALVGSRLRAAGRCPSWITDATFRRMRIAAEQQARDRRESWGREVSLFDIWREMPLEAFGNAMLEELVATEVDVEREITVVDLDIAQVVQLAKKHDVPLVLVSDTYFTEEHLRFLLDRQELGTLAQDARVFRSHQHGLDKASGLWEIVLAELGREPEQLVHIGDNEIADHEVPAELGIRTLHYQRIDEDFAATLDREREQLDPFGPHATHLDPQHGDLGLTSLRAKVLQSRPPGSDTAWRYGASVLGPVLTGFAEWAARWAHETGTPVLWCPMREGELLARLINDAAQARGWEVHARPLWLSRHVVTVAALDRFDEQSIADFLRKPYQPTVRQLLAMLHLRPGEVPALAGELDTVLDHGSPIIERVAVALTEAPHIRSYLAARVAATRDRLLAVLRDAGALDGPELTMVDLGWGGTIQYYLAQVLKTARTGVTPNGLYLATDYRSTRVYLAGLRAEGYLAQAGHPHEVAATLSRSPEVIEQCVNALCGSLVDFAEGGAPVLSTSSAAPSQDAQRRAVQDGIVEFQRHWNRYVNSAAGSWPDLTEAGRDRLGRILVAAHQAPAADEAALFGNWKHEDNLGSAVVTRILPEDLEPAIPYLSPNDLADLDMRDTFWPALIAAANPHLAAAVQAITAGHADPAMFEPCGKPFRSRLLHRSVDGRWQDGPSKRVRINHNGLSFARLSFDGGDTDLVSLVIPGRPAIVRIDWIEARLTAAGRQVSEPIRWDCAEDFAGLGYRDGRWLGANMVEFLSSDGAVILPLAARAGGPVTAAQITVGFAVLPQSMSRLAPRLPGGPAMSRVSARLRQEYRVRGATGVAVGAARVALRKLAGPA